MTPLFADVVGVHAQGPLQVRLLVMSHWLPPADATQLPDMGLVEVVPAPHNVHVRPSPR